MLEINRSLTKESLMEDLVMMSEKELKRAEMMPLIEKGVILQVEAAQYLNITTRHLSRLYQKYRVFGIKGLRSKKRGKTSNNKLNELLLSQIEYRINERYPDFQPTLAHEKLTEEDGFKISLSSVRKLMIEKEIYKPKRVKKKRIHPRRDRRPRFGELIQIDGSDHAWFEDRRGKCCLIVFIDDATSNLVGLRFVEAECTEGYFTVMQDYLPEIGRPLAVYSDKHGIFRINHGCNKEGSLSQFGRAMKELDIKTICAHSPEAKGRVERANGTLQNRLVKELRLREISTIEEANAFLPEYMKDYNRRFSVEPQNSSDAHRALNKSHNLERILSIYDTRKVSKTLSFQYKNVQYQILEEGWKARKLIGKRVEVCKTLRGEIRVFDGSKELVFSRSELVQKHPKEVDSKSLNSEFESWLKKKKWTPSKNHPYRRYKSSSKLHFIR